MLGYLLVAQHYFKVFTKNVLLLNLVIYLRLEPRCQPIHFFMVACFALSEYAIKVRVVSDVCLLLLELQLLISMAQLALKLLLLLQKLLLRAKLLSSQVFLSNFQFSLLIIRPFL